MNRLLIILPILLFLSCTSTNKTTEERNTSKLEIVEEFQIPKESDVNATVSHKDSCLNFISISKTPDYIYIDSTIYMMHKSPLEYFKGYKNLYNEYSQVQAVEQKIIYGQSVPSGDNKYQCSWYIIDDMLYLGNISFYTIDINEMELIFPNNNHYKMMENLTGISFNKSHIPMSIYSSFDFGVMPVTWFSDTLLLKEVRSYDEDITSWDNMPCKELTFIKGKLNN